MVKIMGIIIVTLAVIGGIASRFIFKKSDNVVEEIAEDIIKRQTGKDVDLSPDTPENVPKEQRDYDGQDK